MDPPSPSLSFSTLKTLLSTSALILVPIQSASVASPFKAMYCIYSRHSLGLSKYFKNCIYVSRFEILRFLEKYFWIKRPSWSF